MYSKIITTAAALREAHLALRHRKLIGLAPEEAALLAKLAAGMVFLPSRAELGAFFNVHQTAFRRWVPWDSAHVLCDPPYNVLAVEAVRYRMIRGAQRVRLRASDFWPALRKREGF